LLLRESSLNRWRNEWRSLANCEPRGRAARADVSTRKIGKQLEGAVRDGALAVIIVEPDGRLTLRDLVKASQAEPAERGSVIAAALRLVQNEG